MDSLQFDHLVRSLTHCPSPRRAVLRLLGGFIAAFVPVAEPAAARRNDRDRQQKSRSAGNPSRRDRSQNRQASGEVQAAKKNAGNGNKGNGKKGGDKKGGNRGKGNKKCKGEKKRCGKSCVNVQTSHNHCGQCRRECLAEQRCQAGDCVGDGPTCRMSLPQVCLPPSCVARKFEGQSHGDQHSVCPTCMRCHRAETRAGEEVCADDLCTGIACDSDRDCLAAFPDLALRAVFTAAVILRNEGSRLDGAYVRGTTRFFASSE
jgi:hypothetical protein